MWKAVLDIAGSLFPLASSIFFLKNFFFQGTRKLLFFFAVMFSTAIVQLLPLIIETGVYIHPIFTVTIAFTFLIIYVFILYYFKDRFKALSEFKQASLVTLQLIFLTCFFISMSYSMKIATYDVYYGEFITPEKKPLPTPASFEIFLEGQAIGSVPSYAPPIGKIKNLWLPSCNLFKHPSAFIFVISSDLREGIKNAQYTVVAPLLKEKYKISNRFGDDFASYRCNHIVIPVNLETLE